MHEDPRLLIKQVTQTCRNKIKTKQNLKLVLKTMLFG